MSIWLGFSKVIADILNKVIAKYGNKNQIQIADTTTHNLLREILIELKILNEHIKIMTDEEISKGDIV